MLETPNLRRMWLAAAVAVGRTGSALKLFRTNSGKAWLPTAGKPQRLANGDVLVPGGRPVALGLGLANGDPVVGQADTNGYLSTIVTPEMVGHRIAVFAFMEGKRTEGGRISKDQRSYAEQVIKDGGVGGVACTPEEASALFVDWLQKFRS